jgi:hypothetical protein
MPTIIDSLIVKLGLDNSEFVAKSKKTGEATEQLDKRLQQSANNGSEGFQTLSKSAVQFLAIIGGTVAVKRFIEQTVETNSSLFRLSQNLKENVETISAWSNITEQAGGSASGLQGTMDMISRAQTELQLTGQSALIPYFSALGLSLADVNGKAKPVSQILLELSDRFSRMDRTTANNMGRMFGIDQGTMNLLLQGREAVEDSIKKQKEFTVTTKQQAEEAQKLYQALTALRQNTHAFGQSLLSGAMPYIERVLGLLGELGDWIKGNQDFVTNFLTVLGIGLAGLAAATIPINTVILAIAGLSGAIALLYQDYQTWKRGGGTFIDWGKWEPGFRMAGKGITWLKGLLNDFIYRAIAGADFLSALFARDWKRLEFAKKEFLEGAPKITEPQLVPDIPDTVEFFQKQGWTREQAVGIAANIKRESNFNHQAVGDGGKAFGLAQWHPDRQAEFSKLFGKSIKDSSFEEQLAFIHFELTQGNERKAGGLLRDAQTGYDAAAIVSKHYERPADREGEADKRGRLADFMLGMPGASRLAMQNPNNIVAGGNTSVETNIGEIKIYTAAQDAKGIADDMSTAMDSLFSSQANYGLR